MRQGLQPELVARRAPAHPHGREALRVRPVRQGLLPQLGAHPAPAHPHGPQALRVQRVRQGLPPPRGAHRALQDAHARAALRVRPLRQGLPRQLAPPPPPEGPRGRPALGARLGRGHAGPGAPGPVGGLGGQPEGRIPAPGRSWLSAGRLVLCCDPGVGGWFCPSFAFSKMQMNTRQREKVGLSPRRHPVSSNLRHLQK